ncbi:MAG: head-tail adaptor protein [Phaeodactylibacter sp.]|nr:head-tail adaptor protein [Phaeodactylibacter sp.]
MSYRLDRTIEIFQPTRTTGSTGQIQRTWTLLGERYAALMPKRAAGAEIDAQLTEQKNFEMVVRYDATIRPGYAIRHQGVAYWIDFIKPDGRLKWLILGINSADNKQPDLPSL